MVEQPLFIGPPVIEDSSLSQKIRRCFEERITQGNFLPREQWEEKLAESLASETTMVVIIDLVGGRRLGEAFQSRMQNVINAIETWRGKIEGITPGRKIEENERLPGQDEVLLIVHKNGEFSFEEILNELNEEMNRTVGPESVYIAASINQPGTTKEEALKAADIALRRVKEETKGAKEEKLHKPGVVTVSPEKIQYNDQEIDRNELRRNPMAKPPFPPYIVTRNVVEQLRSTPPSGRLMILSPRRMADINADLGMDGGNEILFELAEKIKLILERKGISDPKIYKIGTTFIIPDTKFTQQELERLASELPYGLAYSELAFSSK